MRRRSGGISLFFSACCFRRGCKVCFFVVVGGQCFQRRCRHQLLRGNRSCLCLLKGRGCAAGGCAGTCSGHLLPAERPMAFAAADLLLSAAGSRVRWSAEAADTAMAPAAAWPTQCWARKGHKIRSVAGHAADRNKSPAASALAASADPQRTRHSSVWHHRAESLAYGRKGHSARLPPLGLPLTYKPAAPPHLFLFAAQVSLGFTPDLGARGHPSARKLSSSWPS